MKNRSSCAGWKEQLQSKIQEVDIGFQYKEIDSRQYCLLDRMEHSYIKIRGEIRVISMPLLYHAYVYLEFLILACTIYILAPIVVSVSDGIQAFFPVLLTFQYFYRIIR